MSDREPNPDNEQVPLAAGFAAWSMDEPVAQLRQVAAWLRDCAEKVEANGDEWRAMLDEVPPEVMMADFLRDRALGLDDYATVVATEEGSGGVTP